MRPEGPALWGGSLTFPNPHDKRHTFAAQLQGPLWKDHSPVIGIQLENEFGGTQQHLITLKTIARAAGLDTPVYARTRWPVVRGAPIPFGEMLPLFGDYAEGFWDRTLDTMPGGYWAPFNFAALPPICLSKKKGPPTDVVDGP